MAASRTPAASAPGGRRRPRRAPTGRRRRIFVAAVFGAVTLTAMSVPAAVGVPVSGERSRRSTVSDNFDRANGALGSSWTTVSGTAAPRIVSDNLRAGPPARLTALTGVPIRSAMISSLRRPCRTARVLSTGRESRSG